MAGKGKGERGGKSGREGRETPGEEGVQKESRERGARAEGRGRRREGRREEGKLSGQSPGSWMKGLVTLLWLPRAQRPLGRGVGSPQAVSRQLLGKALLVCPAKEEHEEAMGPPGEDTLSGPCPTHLCPFSLCQQHSRPSSTPRMKTPPPAIPATTGRGSTVQGMLIPDSGGLGRAVEGP